MLTCIECGTALAHDADMFRCPTCFDERVCKREDYLRALPTPDHLRSESAANLTRLRHIIERLRMYAEADEDCVRAPTAVLVLGGGARRDRLGDEIGRFAIDDERFLLELLGYDL